MSSDKKCVVSEPSKYFPTLYQEFIHLSRYARWKESEGRRETWSETVDRYVDFMFSTQCNGKMDSLKEEVRDAILKLDVMPSMRCLMTAGPALEKDQVAGYNCSYCAIDDMCAFDEILYILMCGAGVGFSVERQFIDKLPVIPEKLRESKTIIAVEDSKIGWANATRELISMLYQGRIPQFDVSAVRPAGMKLKTFGGRASGPGPLIDLFNFLIHTFRQASGRKLNSIECHDICCKIGEIVVVGGVRRCLPGGTPVFTPKGPKDIKDIRPGDVIVSGGEFGKVVAAGPSGEKDTITIHHRFGKLECTPEHRVAVFNSIMKYEFKMAADIVEGDRLVWDSVGYEGGKTELPVLEEDIHFNSKTPTIPAFTTDVAWFLGLFHGDGCVEENGIEISGNMHDIAILERAAGICESAFGVEATFGHDGREGGVGARLRSNSVVLSRWFGKNIKRSHETIHIPDFIWSASREIRLAYLSGLLDADGRVRKDGAIDQACTVYLDYAEELVTLLAGLGIAAVISDGNAEKRRKKGVKAQDFNNVRIVGNTNRRTFYEGCLPFSYKLSRHTPNFSGSTDFSFPIRWGGTNQGYKTNGNILVSSMRYDLPLLPSRVVTVEKGRSVDTYDIQVEGLERFTANGLVVHNSALISLSNPSDDRMRYAKSGEWWKDNPQRSMANNSACYTEKPECDRFMREWLSLMDSKSGERGIFNRTAAKKNIEKYGRRDPNHEFGSNPCSEIVLRSCGFCNLSEVVVRNGDNVEDMKRKVRIATIIGTMQSTMVNFRYLRPKWKENAEEERLLGVSLTGIMDNPLTSGREGKKKLTDTLDLLREYAVSVNKEYAKVLGVPQSAAITCVKPSGTVSQLVNCASGIHPRFSHYYIRTVRADKKDPLAKLMVDLGFPCEDDVMKPNDNYVFSFPEKCEKDACVTNDICAIDQLELWKSYQKHWTEHKPSITVYVKDHEWLEVGAWVYKNFDEISGIAFLPYSGHTYRQAPYQEINEAQYIEALGKMPKDVDWSLLKAYEVDDDALIGYKELACSGGKCEDVDVVRTTPPSRSDNNSNNKF